MSAVMSRKRATSAPAKPLELTLDDMVLLRIWAEPATRADLQRDLAGLFAHYFSGTAFRRATERAISNYAAAQWLTDIKGGLEITTPGADHASARLHVQGDAPASPREGWLRVRDALIARALGLDRLSAAQCKAFDRADGLAVLIVQQHFGLSMQRVQSANALRAQLAVIALERAFGNKIKTGLGKGTGLPGKAGRLLAGQLFTPPREFPSDGKLITALATDISGAKAATAEALQAAVLRRLLTASEQKSTAPAFDSGPRPTPASNRRRPTKPLADNDIQPMSDVTPAFESVSANSPDLDEFASAVVLAARPISEGWPGNRKAFISLVWQAIRHTRPDWGLTEVAFKSMLTEAHRAGRIVLAGADLKGRSDLKELEESKVLYKNTVWHFVRVED